MGKLNLSISLELVTKALESGAQRAKNALRSLQYQAVALAGAMGATASISGLVRQMIETARQSGKARIVLRNVSQTAKEYGDNLVFLRKLTNELGVDIISSTEAYAKLAASANAANLSLEDQQKIFGNVSKAIAAFQLSGEESKLALMAITQMMAKGKVSAEELRRQLGERMPVAMEAMARAAEVKMNELDKLLKKGAINSRDVMAQFSEHLVALIPSLNLDNLETDLGKLKNAFTGLVDKLGVYDAYRTIIKKTTELIHSIQSGWAGLVAFLSGIGGMLTMKSITSSFGREKSKVAQEAVRASEAYISASKERQRKEAKLLKADEQLAKRADELHKAQDAVTTNAPNAKLEKRIRTYQSALAEEQRITNELSKSEARLKALKGINPSVAFNVGVPVSEKFGREVSKMGSLMNEYALLTQKKTKLDADISTAKSNGASKTEIGRLERELERTKKAIDLNDRAIASSRVKINQELTKAIELEEKRRDKLEQYRTKRQESNAQQELRIEADKNKQLASLDEKRAKAQQALDSAREKQEKAMSEVSEAIAQENEKREQAVMQRFRSRYRSGLTAIKNMFRTTFAQIGTIIKSTLSSLAIGAIAGAIGWVIAKVVELYNHSKKIKSLYSDYKKEMQGVSLATDAQIIKLNALRDLYNKNKDNVSERKKIEGEIVSIIGLQTKELEKQGKSLDEYLNKYVDRFTKMKLLEKQTDALADAKLQARARISEIMTEKGLSGEMTPQRINRAIEFDKARNTQAGRRKYAERNGGITDEVKRDVNALAREVFGKDYLREISELLKVEADAESSLKERTKELLQMKSDTSQSNNDGGGGGKEDPNPPEKTPLQKATEKFLEGVRELDNRKRAGHFNSDHGIAEYQAKVSEVANRAIEEIGGILGAKSSNNSVYRQAQQLLVSTDAKYTELRAEQAKEIAKQVRLQENNLASERETIRLRASHAKAEAEYLLSKETLTDAQRSRLEVLRSIIKQDDELSNIQRDLQDSIIELNRVRKATSMKEQEYQLALAQLYLGAMNRAVQAKGVSEQERSDRVQTYAHKASRHLPEPQYQERDKTFDYSKTESQIMLEDKEHLDQYVSKLEEINKHTGEWTKEIEELIAKSKSLEQAFKLSKIKEDIKGLQDSIAKARVQGIKHVANAINNLQSSLRAISDAFDPEKEATAWERFFGVFNAVFQITDGVLSMIEMFKTIKTLTEQLTKATETLSAVNKVKTAEEVAGATASTTAAVASSTAKAKANVTEATTAMTAAGANVAKAHSWIPFAGVAIAGAMIGAMVAMVARSGNSIPRYANGGIVPGTSYNGDRQLAYVNSGELILNTAQQGHLASALKGSHAKRIEVNVVGELRGRDVLKLVQAAERKANR